MSNREKVIAGLNHCFHGQECCGDEQCPYFIEHLSDACCLEDCQANLKADAIVLLEEQGEPKHIIRKQCKKEWEDGYIEYFAEWYCPHCNSLMAQGFDNPSIKFCYRCGKPITWECW